MSAWLDPVRAALSTRDRPLVCFVRDDDGGWDDPALDRLLERAERRGVVIDVAAIPAALAGISAEFGDRLRRGVVRVHQHGFAHLDHAVAGRKCEFGDERDLDSIEADLRRGRDLLADRFGGLVDPVFTPPWNRCSQATARLVERLGYTVLSREHGAPPFGLATLREVPVTFDWSSRRLPDLVTRGVVLADQIRSLDSVGIMLHHAVTSVEELDEIERLFAVLTGSPLVRMTPIGALAGQVVGT